MSGDSKNLVVLQNRNRELLISRLQARPGLGYDSHCCYEGTCVDCITGPFGAIGGFPGHRDLGITLYPSR